MSHVTLHRQIREPLNRSESPLTMTSSPQIPLQRNHAADNRNSPAVDFYLCRPLQTLTVLFIAWKTILFLIVANCPGFGYDTSTALLAASASVLPSSHPASSSLLPSIPFLSFSSFSSAPWKFVRWDAIYFVRVAERGYLYEQEWAWGYGYTQTLGYLASSIVILYFNIGHWTLDTGQYNS